MASPEEKLERIHRELRTDLEEGGIEAFVALLEGKARHLRQHLRGEAPDLLGAASVIFGLRNKDPQARAFLTRPEVVARVQEALPGLRERGGDPEAIEAALEGLELSRRQRRQLHNLLAELLHFDDPERLPLNTVWVVGEARSMGALDYLYGRPPGQGVTDVAERHRRTRAWLEELGYYRDLAYVQDVYYAKAYVLYMVEMTSGMGLLDQQFGQGVHAVDYMSKLLGVDEASSRHWMQLH